MVNEQTLSGIFKKIMRCVTCRPGWVCMLRMDCKFRKTAAFSFGLVLLDPRNGIDDVAAFTKAMFAAKDKNESFIFNSFIIFGVFFLLWGNT